MKIVWAGPARREWAEHYRFYATRNPQAARRMQQLVMAGVNRLRDFPRMGRPGRVAGTRELVIAGTPFLLVYDETPVRIEIVHVYHSRQDWQPHDQPGVNPPKQHTLIRNTPGTKKVNGLAAFAN